MSGLRFPSLLAATLIAFGVGACARMVQPGAPAPVAGTTNAPNGVTTKTEDNGRYLIVIGPRQQHAPPFFGIADTNYFVLRSLVDRTNGKTAHQLFVEDSYVGPEARWDAAHDGWGQTLRFIPISHHELACESGKCSYAEEFAASIPEPELRGSPNGMEVTFTDKAGHKQTIRVPGNLIAMQIAAFDTARAAPGAAPAAAAASPSAAALSPPTASAPATAAAPVPSAGALAPPASFSPTAPPAYGPPPTAAPMATTGGMPPPSAFSPTVPPYGSPPAAAPMPPAGGMPAPSAFSPTAPPPYGPPPAATPMAPSSGMPPPSAFSPTAPASSEASLQPGDQPPAHPRRHAHRMKHPPEGTAQQGSVPPPPAIGGAAPSALPEPAPTEPGAEPEAPGQSSGMPIAAAPPGAGSTTNP
jgi:hypothetical protein